MSTLRSRDILGHLIDEVIEVDLPFEKEAEFQSRRIIVKLESGLRFALNPGQEIVKEGAAEATIVCFDGPADGTAVYQRTTSPVLNSPVTGLFLPYGWECSVGVAMQNGFVLHDGFSMHDNGVLGYQPAPTTLAEFVAIILPE